MPAVRSHVNAASRASGLVSNDVHVWIVRAHAAHLVSRTRAMRDFLVKKYACDYLKSCGNTFDAWDLRIRTAVNGGKPRIYYRTAPVSLHFNCSHSGEIGLCAFSLSEIGVDVEQERELPELLMLVDQCLHPKEIAKNSNASASERTSQFYRCWVRKEAYLKANGLGLTANLKNIDTTRPRIADQIVSNHSGRKETTHWYFHDIRVCLGYRATFVSNIESPRLTVHAATIPLLQADTY
jgi:phosphopantetheinyl transferase